VDTLHLDSVELLVLERDCYIAGSTLTRAVWGAKLPQLTLCYRGTDLRVEDDFKKYELN